MPDPKSPAFDRLPELHRNPYGARKPGSEDEPLSTVAPRENNTSQKFVSYLRVSTKKQGEMGLGMEAQRDAVKRYIEGEKKGKIVKEFVEVESGRNDYRKELKAAMRFCKRTGAVLVVAKLDRLGRSVAFLSALKASGVHFVAADNPHANTFTIHILAAVAEHEHEMISSRTKAGLAMAKRRGVKLGSSREGHWDGREEARAEGLKKAVKKAAELSQARRDAWYAEIGPIAWKIKHTKTKKGRDRSLVDAAAVLNREGERTRMGKLWTPQALWKVLRWCEEHLPDNEKERGIELTPEESPVEK